MLNIYPVSLEVIQSIQPLIRQVARRNRSLADQLSRSSCSVALNLCEGDGHRGASRRHKYEIALGEARETRGALDIIEACGLGTRPDGVNARLDHVIGVLVKLTR